MSAYGLCPECGAEAIVRERRINGNDTCANGHVYPSALTMNAKQKERDALLLAIASAAQRVCTSDGGVSGKILGRICDLQVALDAAEAKGVKLDAVN